MSDETQAILKWIDGVTELLCSSLCVDTVTSNKLWNLRVELEASLKKDESKNKPSPNVDNETQ